MEGYGYPNPGRGSGYVVEGFEFTLKGSEFALTIVPRLIFWHPLLPIEHNLIEMRIVVTGGGMHVKNVVFEMDLNECSASELPALARQIDRLSSGQSKSLRFALPEPKFECQISRDRFFPTGWSMTCVAATPRRWNGDQPTLKHEHERGQFACDLSIVTAFEFDSLAKAKTDINAFLFWLQREASDLQDASADEAPPS